MDRQVGQTAAAARWPCSLLASRAPTAILQCSIAFCLLNSTIVEVTQMGKRSRRSAEGFAREPPLFSLPFGLPSVVATSPDEASGIPTPLLLLYSADKHKRFQLEASKAIAGAFGPVRGVLQPKDGFVYVKPLEPGTTVVFDAVEDGNVQLGPRLAYCTTDAQVSVPVWVTPLENTANPEDKRVRINLMRRRLPEDPHPSRPADNDEDAHVDEADKKGSSGVEANAEDSTAKVGAAATTSTNMPTKTSSSVGVVKTAATISSEKVSNNSRNDNTSNNNSSNVNNSSNDNNRNDSNNSSNNNNSNNNNSSNNNSSIVGSLSSGPSRLARAGAVALGEEANILAASQESDTTGLVGAEATGLSTERADGSLAGSSTAETTMYSVGEVYEETSDKERETQRSRDRAGRHWGKWKPRQVMRPGRVELRSTVLSLSSIDAGRDLTDVDLPTAGALQCLEGVVRLYVGHPVTIPNFLNKTWKIRVVVRALAPFSTSPIKTHVILQQMSRSDGVVTDPPQTIFPLTTTLNRFEYDSLKMAGALREQCVLKSVLSPSWKALGTHQGEHTTAVELSCRRLTIEGHDRTRYRDFLKQSPEAVRKWIENDVTAAGGQISNMEGIRTALNANVPRNIFHPLFFYPMAFAAGSWKTFLEKVMAAKKRSTGLRALMKAAKDISRDGIERRYRAFIRKGDEKYIKVGTS